MEIPKEIISIIRKLNKAGFEAYVVGGCVRDLARGAEPQDWDIATNAKPEEIKKVFPDSFYENNFFTVTAHTSSKKPNLKEVEITTFRLEAKYTDKRHPDEIRFAKTLEEDLARRDFTINAMALKISGARSIKIEIIDPFQGREDFKKKVIRTVGIADERFNEDALRMMRAIRLTATLADGWIIEEKTAEAVKKHAQWIKVISHERIRDELVKIIMSPRAFEGIELLRKLGLLTYILPELEEGCSVSQNKHHIYECYEHNLLSLKYASEQNFSKEIRIASLFHDIGKPRAKAGQGLDSTFYNHEIIGARMTEQILNRLKFPKKETEKIVRLVRYHLFYYNVGEVSESSVRRLVREAGPENMEDLLKVRMADRIGSGVPKAEPYKLRHLKYVIDKVSQDPISSKMLKIDGNAIMKILGIKPGPAIGHYLDILLGEVLEDPKKNKKEFLVKQTNKLGKMKIKELENLAKKAKEERMKVETKRDEMTKNKYWVT
ncbi:MAG: HD domain-containing protein [Candidatus Parcubacteria bacterium]|nr:HD domain-containing protein [Candidatus Parcubacteria bacterium]